MLGVIVYGCDTANSHPCHVYRASFLPQSTLIGPWCLETSAPKISAVPSMSSMTITPSDWMLTRSSDSFYSLIGSWKVTNGKGYQTYKTTDGGIASSEDVFRFPSTCQLNRILRSRVKILCKDARFVEISDQPNIRFVKSRATWIIDQVRANPSKPVQSHIFKS